MHVPIVENFMASAPRSTVVVSAKAKGSPQSLHSSPDRPKRKTPAVTPDGLVPKTVIGSKRKRPSATTIDTTHSFEPFWAASIPTIKDPVEPHTLLLGTHPSIASLSAHQYFGHTMNAFWWIAGDCLGFRRGTGVSLATGDPYKFASALRYSTDYILSYEEQLEQLTMHGFALWDIVASCQREGSLDRDIRKEEVNDIAGFCRDHPSVQRIVFVNGGTGSKLFVKHFVEWFKSGHLVAASDEASQKAFRAPIQRHTKGLIFEELRPKIELVSAISVSPAAARSSYAEKRDYWEAHIYRPGLALLLEKTA